MFLYVSDSKDPSLHLDRAELAAVNLADSKCKFGPQAVTAQFLSIFQTKIIKFFSKENPVIPEMAIS